jgi:repressor LexA
MTKRQKICLDMIRAYWGEHGFAPSFEDLRVALGAKSKSSVANLIAKLESRGHITRTPNLARSIQVVDRAA